MDEQNMSVYFRNDSPNDLYRDKIRDFVKLVRITSSGWLDMPSFTKAFREKWSQQNLITDELFDASLLTVNSDSITYKEKKFKKIIFCEGYKCTGNQFWQDIPLVPAKGEIATIECKDLSQDFILLSGMFMIPIGNDLFRCGATYEWNFNDELPTEAGKNKLVKMIGDVVKTEWKMISHTSGVRPTVRDRRPIIGAHAQHKNVMIYNGMGTKGVMLAPYFASHFADYLLHGSELDVEVNVSRFRIKSSQ
jgi:glycine/D-amino acid oxidase-like deaminating enzyme